MPGRRTEHAGSISNVRCHRAYNWRMRSPRFRTARLSRDTDRDAEDRLVEAWRAASTIELARMISGASEAARALALAGLRSRYPDADPDELTARLARITLGPDLARRVYPQLDHLDP